MRIGVVFPQTELGGDVGAVRAYGEGVEALGFSHVLAYDHVVGADPEVHRGWAGPYNVRTTFHERKDFSNRGERLDEQVTLMRRLWTEPSVTHHGVHETVTGAGLAPLPVQRPIPVWFGAVAQRALRRVGRLGNGWFPQVPPGDKLEEARATVRQAAVDAGRDRVDPSTSVMRNVTTPVGSGRPTPTTPASRRSLAVVPVWGSGG